MATTIAIVGAGRVGRALGRRLHELGWTIGAVVTRSKSTARAAVRAIGAGQASAGLSHRVLDATLVLICTPDDAIVRVASDLARIGGREWRDKIVLHTSGALDRTVLESLARCGASAGSLHPLQSFSGHGVPPLGGAIFAIEGDPLARRAARRIAHLLGGIPVAIEGRFKPAYHAACVFAAGHSLGMIEAAVQILMRLGFSRRRAKMALLPLMRRTLDNFERLGAREAWTGPVARGDFSTVARHRRALKEWREEFSEAYAALARLSARVVALHPEQTLRKFERAWKKN
jgi:predicted short-subunit dehydrogenase-like oxidoreductase (DUF2520 family)